MENALRVTGDGDPVVLRLGPGPTEGQFLIEVRDGDNVGYGIMEYGVGKGYERYQQVQAHPAI